MVKKDFFVNVRFTEGIYKELHTEPHKASKIVREAVKEWLQYFKFDIKKLCLSDNENYAIVGKIGSGKTTLVKSLLKGVTRKKIIIDTTREYSDMGEWSN